MEVDTYEYLPELEQPNEVIFSDKYQPLFEVLECKNDLEQLRAVINLIGIDSIDEETNSRYVRLEQLRKVDTVLISGGRDSGKTYCKGVFTVVATSDHNHRILATRQTMASTGNSITRALKNRMEMMGVLEDYNEANNDFEYKNGKGRISITGQKTSTGTQTAKLKSIEDYSIFDTDEGEELVSYEEWLKIKRSMRATDVQTLSIISFNPPSKRHWLYEQFYLGVPEGFNGVIGNVMYIHTTYLDNGKENMAEQNWNDYEKLRLQYETYEALDKEQREAIPRSARLFKDWREYKTTILGGFKEVAEGVIFDYSIGQFVESLYEDIYGADYGWTDPTAVVKVNVLKKEKKVYLKQIFFQSNATESKICDAIKPIVGYSRIWVDDSAAGFIAGLKERKLNAKGAKKCKVLLRVNKALDYEIIIDPESKELIAEFDEYRWSSKRKEAPVDEKNHAMDAWMYAFWRIVNTSIIEAGTHS